MRRDIEACGSSHGLAPRTTPHPPPSDPACLGRRCRWLLRTPPAARGPLQVKASPTTLAPSIRRDGEVFDEMLRGLRFLLRLCAWGNNRDMIFVDRDLLLVENYSNSRGRAFLGSLPQYLEAGQTAHSNTNPSNSSFVICLSRLSFSGCDALLSHAQPIRSGPPSTKRSVRQDESRRPLRHAAGRPGRRHPRVPRPPRLPLGQRLRRREVVMHRTLPAHPAIAPPSQRGG